jgi:hypothetical protein
MSEPLDPRQIRIVVEPRVEPGKPPEIPGSERRRCTTCRQPVWASPSSVETLRSQDYLICIECAGRLSREMTLTEWDALPVRTAPGWGADMARAAARDRASSQN